MLKVDLEVIKEVKVDGRNNNTGRPVNKKSARQQRLNNQAYLSNLNKLFKEGNQFKYKDNVYSYRGSDNDLGCIVSNVMGYVCNVEYIGRTKVQAFTFVMGKRVNIELNLKTLQFVSE